MTYKPITNFRLYIVILLKKVFLVFKGVAKHKMHSFYLHEKKNLHLNQVFLMVNNQSKKGKEIIFCPLFFHQGIGVCLKLDWVR